MGDLAARVSELERMVGELLQIVAQQTERPAPSLEEQHRMKAAAQGKREED